MRLTEMRETLRRIPASIYRSIRLEFGKSSIDRIRLASWVAFAVYVFLLYVDYRRAASGNTLYDQEPYVILRWIHWAGLLFVPILVIASFWNEHLRDNRRHRLVIIYSFLLIMVLAVFSNAILSFHIRGSLVLYVGFILVANWTISMNFRQRTLLNFCSLLIMGYFIFFPVHKWTTYTPFDDMDVERIIQIYEVFFMTVIAFVFGLFDEAFRMTIYFNRWELAKDKVDLQRLERTRSHLLANIAHEFRTPLTIISGLTNQIVDTSTNDKSSRIQMIDRNAHRMLELVNEILTLSKLEEGNLPLNITRENLVAFMHYVEDCFSGQADAANVELEVDVPYVELHLDFDREVLFKVIANLVSNAIKYTQEGGKVSVDCRVSTAKDGDVLEIDVQDTGPGISQTDLPHIFERFYRAEGTGLARGGSEGTGIGLSIVKELVQAMNGEIIVNSRLGEGTVFSILLPVTAGQGPEHSVRDSGRIRFDSLLQAGDVDSFAEALNRGTILVVEDNRDVNDLVVSCLVPDFQVIQAYDGVQGELLTQDLLPDLVISDIRMPRKDGLTLCDSIKKSELTSHIPVILLTAVIDDEIKSKGLEAGAIDIVLKPFDGKELYSKVVNVIEFRDSLRARYSEADIDLETANGTPEEKFILQVRNVIKENLDDADFRVTNLCRKLGMSRTQLHNKLKALTGKSTTAFIRDIRLVEARRMLLKSDLTISEIAYDVGFADPSYFTRVFTGVYGMSPSEFRQSEVG